MDEVINTNVFNATKKFVDFAGLDYFWEKAKAYVDGVDAVMAGKISALETTVSDESTGLVKKVADLKATVDTLTAGGDGSVASQIDTKIATLDVDDTAVDGQYVSAVSEIDGKVVVTRAALPDYTEVYDAKGAAATALTEAKAYADGLNNAMNDRVDALEAIDHNKIATDAAAAAVAGVIDGAPEKFDTLKEIAQWISDSEAADSAADLVTRVSALEAIDHDAYIAADTTLKSELESKINTKVDAVEGSRLMTSDEGTKLSGIEDGAQVNVIESLEINGVTATIIDKKASVTLDCYTKNDVNIIIEENERVTAESLTDLDTRVKDLKNTTYNKTEIDTIVENIIVVASKEDIDSLFV